MENTSVVSVSDENSLPFARTQVADLAKRAYGAERHYSRLLNVQIGADANGRMWFEVEAKEVSDFAKVVHAEKGELFKELKKVAHTNPSTIWARVRKYGKEENFLAQGLNADGSDPKAEKVEGEGEGEGEGKGAGSRNKTLTVRFIDELTLLYKAGKRAEGLSDSEQKALIYISSALQALGINLSMLDLGK
jgi:hypothetical protein